jgi:hypothetical protein
VRSTHFGCQRPRRIRSARTAAGFSPGAVTRAGLLQRGIRSDRTRGRFHSIRHVRAVAWLLRALAMATQDDIDLLRASIMGKYFLGWILGVPVFVYLFNF